MKYDIHCTYIIVTGMEGLFEWYSTYNEKQNEIISNIVIS
jgi:hypothetical protein